MSINNFTNARINEDGDLTVQGVTLADSGESEGLGDDARMTIVMTSANPETVRHELSVDNPGAAAWTGFAAADTHPFVNAQTVYVVGSARATAADTPFLWANLLVINAPDIKK